MQTESPSLERPTKKWAFSHCSGLNSMSRITEFGCPFFLKIILSQKTSISRMSLFSRSKAMLVISAFLYWCMCLRVVMAYESVCSGRAGLGRCTVVCIFL